MKPELLFIVMLIVSVAASLLVLWNRRRVALKHAQDYAARRLATGGYFTSPPYRAGNFQLRAWHLPTQREFPTERMEPPHTEGIFLDSCFSVPMPEVCKPTTVTIKSYTKADLTAAFEKGRLTERAELIKQLSSTKPGVRS